MRKASLYGPRIWSNIDRIWIKPLRPNTIRIQEKTDLELLDRSVLKIS